jgi:fluoroacetyl-CoA thioesterase
MKPIPTGALGRYVHRVESAHLANSFKDSILPPVFSTPYLILIMENAALNAIKEYLEAGESAVGTRVDVRHLVATPVGREVIGHAEVTGSDGRRIFFRVWATDQDEEIGAGTHERMVVNVSRIIERMTAKYGAGSAAS